MSSRPRVGLFVTCLVDLMRPRIGFAAVKLLEQSGCDVEVPRAQTCCGQPAWNSGDDRNAAAIARQVVDAFEGFDYVVAPSGSCAGMIRVHYAEALASDPAYAQRAAALAAKTHDLVSFFACAALIGFGDFFSSSQTALLSEVVPGEHRTKVLAGYRFSADLGAFLGPVVLAAVMDLANAQAAILLAAAVLVSASLAARFGVPARVDERPAHVPAAVAAIGGATNAD